MITKGSADLHMHTYYSDGFLSPTEIVQKAKSADLDAISITDHDSVNGLDEAITEGTRLGIEVIPGVEISTDVDDTEVHLLGYFINYKNAEFEKYLEFFRSERYYRAERIISKLNRLGIPLTIEDVMEEANFSAIGRPHIAVALYKKGFVNNYYEAFHKYIGDHRPAEEKKIHVSAKSAFKIINEAGGLTFIAHPSNMSESVLQKLINWGIDGIEVIHPSHDRRRIKYYRGIVYQYCLLESGGSDFHGGEKNDDQNFGKYAIAWSKVETIKNMLPNQEISE